MGPRAESQCSLLGLGLTHRLSCFLSLLHFQHPSSLLDCSGNSEFLSLYFTEHLHYSLQKSLKCVVEPSQCLTCGGFHRQDLCALESGGTYRLMRHNFVFLSKIHCSAIEPLTPGCCPWLEASGDEHCSFATQEECRHLKEEKLALFKRPRERLLELMPVCLEAKWWLY